MTDCSRRGKVVLDTKHPAYNVNAYSKGSRISLSPRLLSAQTTGTGNTIRVGLQLLAAYINPTPTNRLNHPIIAYCVKINALWRYLAVISKCLCIFLYSRFRAS